MDGSLDNNFPAERTREWKTLLVLFFFSGFPALVYQIVWQRALFRIFGVNIESVTITVTAFMLGLGLGNLAGGIVSRKLRASPLLVLAVIEALTGAFGHFSIMIFERFGERVLGASLPVTAGVTLALVIVPTLLMGATLPLLVAYAVRKTACVGKSVGRLYYVNTLGAGAVCLLASFLLFPFMQSMQGAVDSAAVMNGLIALSAFLAYRREKRESEGTEIPLETVNATRSIMRLSPMLLLGFWSGFVSLSYEIFFFRTVSYASGSSAADFTLTLGAFLIGLASGARRAVESCASDTLLVKKAMFGILMASTLGFAYLPLLAHLGAYRIGDRYITTAVAYLLIYLIARGWGRLLPSLAHLGIAANGRAGLKTAWLYLANIFGSAVGSVLTGFVLMDVFGVVRLSQFLVLAGLLCVVLLAVSVPIPKREGMLHISKAVLVAVWAVLFLPMLSDRVLETLLWKGERDSSVPFAQVVENRNGILTVDQDARVYGNGMYDGAFNTSLVDDKNGILRAYALSYYNASPRKVLQIGLSSGSWAQAIANNPDVDDLTIIEINPGYNELISTRSEVASLLDNPKATIIVDDGRRWLRLHPEEKFDAIISNTTYNFRANTTNLLSVEFLELVKKHLNPEGTFFYNTTDSARVQRTGCMTFPFGARFMNHLILSKEPLNFNLKRWKRSLSIERIDDEPVLDLNKHNARAFFKNLDKIKEASYTGHGKLLDMCADILVRTEGVRLITDDNMGTEWRRQFGME